MAATTKTKQPLGFDQGKLQAMQEPITVRVDKKRGGATWNIPIPGKGDNAASGTNWSREEVLSLENWILTDWSGGGYYIFSITDAAGATMKWETSYDPQLFPEKVPPNQMRAASLPNPQAMPAGAPSSIGQVHTPAAQPIPPHALPLGSTPSVWPPPAATFGYNSQAYQPQLQPQPQPQPQPQQALPPQQSWPWQQPPAWQQWGTPPWMTPLRGFGGQPDRHREEWEKREQERLREQERERFRAEIQQRDEQLRRHELLQKEAEHKAAQERLHQQHAAELQTLRDEMRRLGEKSRDAENEEVKRAREERERMERDRINQQFQQLQQTISKLLEKPAEDPRLRTLESELQQQRESSRAIQEQQQRERERWEATRAQEKLVQEMKDQETRTAAALKEATANRPDATLEYMKESARLSQEQARMQAENMREIARMNQASSDRMAQMMMTPQALAGIIRDSSSNSDTLMRNMVETYSGIFSTMRNAVEQVAQLTGGPQEPPAVRIIEQGIHRAAEMADRYFGAKAAQAQGEARVAAAKAQSDAQVRAAAMHAQAQAAAAAAAQAQTGRQQSFVNEAAKRQAEFVTGSGHAGPTKGNGQPTQAGLSGAPQEEPASPKTASPTDLDDGVTDPETGQTVAKVVPVKRAGRTDEDWFGVALEDVGRLRRGVDTFLTNLQKAQDGETEGVVDEEGNVVGLDPSSAVDAILRGVNYVSAHGIEIPAFEELFKQQQYADLMDIILPDAPQKFRDDCVKILVEEVQVSTPSNVIDVQEEPQPPGS